MATAKNAKYTFALAQRGFSPQMRNLLLLLIAVATFSEGCGAQELRRFEVGIQTTALRTEGVRGSCLGCATQHWAVGPAVSVNLNRTLAIDGTFSVTPQQFLAQQFTGGRMTAAFTGVKGSVRHNRWILFAKARPVGFVHWSHVITGVEFPQGPAAPFTFDFGSRTQFAQDFGGGIEFAMTQRTGLRFEMGDTRIRVVAGRTTENLQISTGVFYRVGQTLRSESRSVAPQDSHRFVDKGNIAIWTASLLAQTADAIATQRTHANCLRNPLFGDRALCNEIEADPLARPFVNHGWSGQIGLAVIVNTAQIGTQYVLHRWGHHRVERVLPVPLMIGNIHGAYQNLQTH